MTHVPFFITGVLALSATFMVLAALLSGYLYLRRSLPKVRGTVKVSGITGPVEIIRDIDAVPHIYARNKLDAYFGLGYVHAQDRLWQMEFQRRFASGQMAAFLGKRAIPFDRVVRSIGMHRAAKTAWQSLSPEAQMSVTAYTAGINACVDKCVPPPEFKLLRIRPERWECQDVMICTKLMAWNLGGTYVLKLLRKELISKLGAARTSLLMFDKAGWMAETNAGPGVSLHEEEVNGEPSLAMFGHGREGVGSNNWVVGGAKSTTNMPVLAADPHLATSMPSTWYVAQLCADDLDAIGATLPGTPGIIMGRNRNISWGLTNANGDVQDLYYERLNEAGTAAEHKGAMLPLREVTEVIKVRGHADLQFDVRISNHGPLISDAMNANAEVHSSGNAAEQPPAVPPMALRWTALENDDTTLEAFLAIGAANSWEEFNEGLKQYLSPPVNFGFADTNGTIAYRLAGHIPIRKWDSRVPAEGWTGKQEWDGAIPFDEMPCLRNPAEHYLVTANTRVLPKNYPYSIGADFVEPYRHNRIVELLASKPRLSIEDHAAIQTDLVSLHAREFLPLLLSAVTARSTQQKRALQALSGWDYTMHTGSVAAAIFAVWFAQIPQVLLRDEMGSKLFQDYQVWGTYVVRFLREWSGLSGNGRADNTTETLQKTFEAALIELTHRFGSNPDKWQWARLHMAIHAHPAFGSIPLLKQLFSRKVRHGGDWSTVNAGGTWSSKGSFHQAYGATYRQIVDLSHEDGGRFILSTGQSGHFLSPHYSDCLKDWANASYRPMRMSRIAVERAREATLWLRPENVTSGSQPV